MTRSTTHLVLFAILLALGGASPAAAQGQAQAILVASGLSQPLFAAAPNGDARLFVVERIGRIRVVKNGVTQPTPFLDIQTRVGTAGEGGLLGLELPSRLREQRPLHRLLHRPQQRLGGRPLLGHRQPRRGRPEQRGDPAVHRPAERSPAS